MNNKKTNNIKRTGKRKVRGSDRTFDIILTIFVTIIMMIILYPMIYVVSSSFSSGSAVSSGKVFLWPVDFSLEGYKLILSVKKIWVGYANSILYAVVTTISGVVMTVMIAYPLSRKEFQGKKFFDIYFLILMFFNGGLIPTYVLMSKIGVVNNRIGFMIMTGGASLYNMVLTRTFFQNTIPKELFEAAKMDGIDDFQYLLKIALPLSKANLSVIALYALVAHWNSYMTPLIYLKDAALHPLPLIVREIMDSARIDAGALSSGAEAIKQAANADLMKYALIVVSAAPMIIIYPFVQKFFDKGVMMGSLKG